MFLKGLFCIFLWLTPGKAVVEKNIVLTNSEAFYRINDVQFDKEMLSVDILLKNNSQSNDWYIQIPAPVGEVTLHAKGLNIPIQVNGTIIPLHLNKGQSRNYSLQIRNNFKLNTPIYIGTLKTIYEKEHFKNILNGFMFGTLLALMIYNLYIYLTNKDKSYLNYSGYIFFSIVFLMIWNGYFTKWLPVWHLKLIISSFAASLTFSILFTNGYLRTAHYAPILFKFHKFLIMTYLIPVGVDLAGFHVLAFQLLQLCLVISIVYWMAAGYFSLRKGFRPSTYYLIALGFLLISYLFHDEFHSAMSLQFGLCLQVLTLSFMLAINLNDLKKETLLLQKAMIAKTAGFSKQLIIGQENEKENIANEINNSIGQQLVLLKNQMFVLKKLSKEDAHDLFNGITKDIGKAIEEVSNVSFSLRPYQIDILGLRRSIENLVKDISDNTETTIHLDIDEIDPLLNWALKINIYRVTQELLNNLIKHSGASHCWINIKYKKGYLKFYYLDNGKGFNTDSISTGFGLSGIRDRCNLMNANINLVSKLGSETKIYIKIPLNLVLTEQHQNTY